MKGATENRNWVLLAILISLLSFFALENRAVGQDYNFDRAIGRSTRTVTFDGAGVAQVVTSPQTFTTLANFQGSANGADPLYGSLILGTDGNGYGTTVGGGLYDQGTVVMGTSDGTLTLLYSFCSQANCADGAEPFSGLVQFRGNFYGTTLRGGITSAGAVGGGTIFEITPSGQLTTLYSFCSQTNCADGAYPFAGLVQFGGNFYGTTESGGANGAGTVFEITPSGQFTTLYSFCSQTDCTDGAFPEAGLVQFGGNFYGTTFNGGISSAGTVFEITPAGQLTTLYSFCSQTYCADGQNPYAALIQASDGNFYGTTPYGGGDGFFGTIFRITPAGQLTTLYSFCSQNGCADGVLPYAGLIQASDGNLYGTTLDGGIYGYGTVFGITLGGQLTTVHSFDLTDGAYPYGGLLEGNNALLYGTPSFGGNRLNGTVFSLPVGLDPQVRQGNAGPSGMIHPPDLTGATSLRRGGRAAANLSLGRNIASVNGVRLSRNLAMFAGGPRAKRRMREFADATSGSPKLTMAGKEKSAPRTAQILTTLLNFNGADGAFPYANSLIQGTDGNLYGTAGGGGVYDQGTVFKVTAGGTLTTLYTFCSQINCADGAEPEAALVQASNGNFYGTTYDGGANGNGSIFEITPAGQLTTLYSFCSQTNCADGAYPQAGLVQGTDGNLYGTTSYGGVTATCYSCGTVFEITPAGQFTTLYSFCSQTNCSDGANPFAPLVLASNGNFYGTTSVNGLTGAGTVFEITPAGQLTTLYSFCAQTNCADGAYPEAGLVQGTDGDLYGTTSDGGTYFAGTVFKITLAGQLTTLYSFCSQTNCADGAYPYAGLVQAGGNFYGTTANGGTSGVCRDGCGTVFEITPAGQLTTLHTFGLTDGAYPESGLLLANGNLYGMADLGGSRFDGTIFSLPVAQVLALSGPTGTAQVGIAYASAVTATGGVAPFTFSVTSGSLPPGLSFPVPNGPGGYTTSSPSYPLAGTPTTTGTYTFTAQVVDSQGNTAIAPYSILVTSAGNNSTNTSLTLAPSYIPVGSAGPIAMTATVTPVSGFGAPTGTVTYFNGSTQIGTATLSGGAGTFNYNPSSLAVGIYSITAVYSGDSAFSASTSAPQTLAITQNGPFAYVANNTSDTVSVINIPTGQVAANVPVGSAPYGVAVSPDQTQVYVANAGGNSVSVIDAASSSVVATIPVQSSPAYVAFTPDGTSAYVANSASNSVSVIDTASQTVVDTVPVQNSPAGVAMALTSNGTFAYVTNVGSNTVSVIAVASNTVVQTIPVGTAPVWVAVSPNSSLAYVSNSGSGTVSVISVATNTVTATVPVGTGPIGSAFTPDSGFAYVANSGSDTVSVIDTKAATVITTVAGFNYPFEVALTQDGSSAYVVNNLGDNVSVVSTASDTVTGTVAVGSAPVAVGIASVPPTELVITQPLSPTQPTTFNFGTSAYQVQYPAGTSFSNVSMTVTAVQITQAQFQQRVAGTQFANAACIVYAGAGGNCVDHQVTCSQNGSPITCPSESSNTIAVQTSFSSPQAIIDPGYLTTPIGQNNWTNIFTGYSDPTVKGKTNGFSEFVAVSLGSSNKQGAATLTLLAPLRATDPRMFDAGVKIPAAFQLTSIANPTKSITNAIAGLTIMWVSDANGAPQSKVILALKDGFHYDSAIGGYLHEINTTGYKPGTYTLSIYGNAFAAQQIQFTINAQLAISPSNIDFGTVLLNERLKKVITLKNIGPVPLTIGEMLFKATEGKLRGFSLHRYCGSTLGVGQSCTVGVKFFAEAVEIDAVTLEIETSAPGGPAEVPITVTVVK